MSLRSNVGKYVGAWDSHAISYFFLVKKTPFRSLFLVLVYSCVFTNHLQSFVIDLFLLHSTHSILYSHNRSLQPFLFLLFSFHQSLKRTLLFLSSCQPYEHTKEFNQKLNKNSFHISNLLTNQRRMIFEKRDSRSPFHYC